jgi:hypothetical protein
LPSAPKYFGEKVNWDLLHRSGRGKIISAYGGYQLKQFLLFAKEAAKKEPPMIGGKVRERR